MNYKSEEKNKCHPVNKCRRCGRLHKLRQCQAYGVECHECGKNNHFAKMCMTKGLIKTKTRASRNVDNVENDFDVDILVQSCA